MSRNYCPQLRSCGRRTKCYRQQSHVARQGRYDSLQKNCAYHAAHYGLGLSLYWSVRASGKIKYGNDMNNPAGKHVPAGIPVDSVQEKKKRGVMAYTVTFCIPCIYPACSGAVSAGRRVILRPPSGPPPSRRRLYNRTPPRQFQTVPRNSCDRTCAQSRRRRQMSPPRAPRASSNAAPSAASAPI